MWLIRRLDVGWGDARMSVAKLSPKAACIFATVPANSTVRFGTLSESRVPAQIPDGSARGDEGISPEAAPPDAPRATL